jgi:hypothetical protein
MTVSVHWSRIMVISGLILMGMGALDPLEGSVVILAGSVVAAIGACSGKRRRWKLSLGAAAMIAIGVGAMFALSAAGGVGGSSGRSPWWALVILPYPAGWIMGLTAAILCLKEFKKAES